MMTLRNACRAAIEHGNHLTDITPSFWAATYHCTTEDIREVWESELTRKSLEPVGFDGDDE